MYIAPRLIFPLLIGDAARGCTSRSSRRGTTRSSAVAATDASSSVVGVPTFPGQAPRSLGLMFAVAGVLFLLGGLVQINPIWLWGPYHVGAGDERRAARLVPRLADRRAAAVPGFDVTIGGYTLVPNPFWGGAALPVLVFEPVRSGRALERRVTGDHGVPQPARPAARRARGAPRSAPPSSPGSSSSSWPARPTASTRSFGLAYQAPDLGLPGAASGSCRSWRSS